MLSAIAEAKDDHLRQSDNIESVTQTGSPWNVGDTTTQSYINEHFDMDIGDERHASSSSTITCCCVPKVSRTGYTRPGRIKGLNDSEEYACLTDCDELEHYNRSNTKNDNNTCSINFEDDFV